RFAEATSSPRPGDLVQIRGRQGRAHGVVLFLQDELTAGGRLPPAGKAIRGPQSDELRQLADEAKVWGETESPMQTCDAASAGGVEESTTIGGTGRTRSCSNAAAVGTISRSGSGRQGQLGGGRGSEERTDYRSREYMNPGAAV
ncbi:unnamed protein product, partial [Amoebophrya sp. A25]